MFFFRKGDSLEFSSSSDFFGFFDHDNELKEVVKRAVEDVELNTDSYEIVSWTPTKKRETTMEEAETSVEELIEKPVTVDYKAGDREGRFFLQPTLRVVVTETTTKCQKYTLGVVGITGKADTCDSTSITNYVYECG